MSSLTANSAKKYGLNFGQTPYCPHYLMCHYSNLYHVYNNYNNNCLVRYAYHTTSYKFKPQLFCSHTTLHTRLIEFLQTVTRFVLPFYIRTLSVCRTFSNWNVFVLAFSRTLYMLAVYLVHVDCVFAYVHLMLMLLVVYLEQARRICL